MYMAQHCSPAPLGSAPKPVATLARSRFELRPYTVDLEDSIREFNARLRERGSNQQFPESHVRDLPKLPGRHVYQDSFVLLRDGTVRGAYMLKYQNCVVSGGIQHIAAGPQLPLSEGIVDPEFALVGVHLVRDAMRRQPMLFAVGMGGPTQAYPRLLHAMGWSTQLVPFYFKVLNANAFLRNIRYLRSRAWLTAVCDALEATGIGAAAVRMARLFDVPGAQSDRLEEVDDFSGWADEVWARCKTNYSFTGVRDLSALQALYPASNTRFLRLRIRRGEQTLGWAVVLDSRIRDNKFFGDMRVGSIADCLAAPQDAGAVISAATEFLKDRRVDVIISNQASAAWCEALLRAGFIRGPSNYLLAFSKNLAGKLSQNGNTRGGIHVNRGDGDGPINL